MAGGDLSSRRRSHRLIKLKEASESEASRMIKLKKEWRALLDRKMARIAAEEKALDARDKALVERIKARLASAPPPRCDPFLRPLSAASSPSPMPCDPPSLLLPDAPPRPAGPAGTKKKTKPIPCDPPSLLLPDAPPPSAGPAGTKKKTKKVVKYRVPQERIDHMILNQRDPYNDGYPLERLRKRGQEFREFYAELRALDEKKFEYRQAIIKQFRQKGYAEDYSETEDDLEEVEVEEEDDAEEN